MKLSRLWLFFRELKGVGGDGHSKIGRRFSEDGGVAIDVSVAYESELLFSVLSETQLHVCVLLLVLSLLLFEWYGQKKVPRTTGTSFVESFRKKFSFSIW